MGVDLNPVAVRLAELRLWLAIIADDPTKDIRSISPLPNLDGVVRQGDTLLDPVGAARSFCSNASFSTNEAAHSVRNARAALFTVRGREHWRCVKQLRELETDVATRMLNAALESTQCAADDLTESAKSRDLFGNRVGLSKTQRKRLSTLIEVRRELKKAHRRLTDGSLPFFSFEVHMPDIIADGGFDVVVGNPPWVRAEELPQGMRHAMKGRFQWWRPTAQSGFAHQPDLSVAFLERCLELTRPGGVSGLLLPSKITSAGYGETARRGVVSETAIEYVHRVPESDAARFGATTYPLALVVKKQRPHRGHRIRLGFASHKTVTQRSLDRPGPWVLLDSETRDALEEFRSSGEPLGDVSPPMLGVKTGADRFFVGRVRARYEGLATVVFADREVLLEEILLRPALRGRDVRRFSAEPSGVILWCHGVDGNPISALPEHAVSYFETCSRNMRRRSDYRGGPLWTLFRTRCVIAENRIVWPDIAKRPRAIVLEETSAPSAIPLNTCYVAPSPDRETALAVAAVMNSSWAAAFFASYADEARGGYRRINARVARLLPVPAKGRRRTELAQLSKRAHEYEGDSKEDLDASVANALNLSQRTQNTLKSLFDNLS
jgi:hypothetical protein